MGTILWGSPLASPTGGAAVKQRKKKKSLRRLKTRLHNGFILDYLKVLSEAEFKCYLILALHADWGTGHSFPSRLTLQEETGLGRRRISKALKALEEKKLISIVYRKPYDKDGTQYGRKRYFYSLSYPANSQYFKP